MGEVPKQERPNQGKDQLRIEYDFIKSLFAYENPLDLKYIRVMTTVMDAYLYIRKTDQDPAWYDKPHRITWDEYNEAIDYINVKLYERKLRLEKNQHQR